MFDFGIGTSELLLIAMVALIVVGPKELPGLLRTIGQWVGKVKALAADFQSHLNDLTQETGVKDIREKVKKDIGDLSIEDLDKEFAEMEKEMREQLAEGAQQPGGLREADDEDLIEEDERPLPETLDLDAALQEQQEQQGQAAEDATPEDAAGKDAARQDAAKSSSPPPEEKKLAAGE